MSRPKIAVSFSGGRSSAVMTKLVVDTYSGTHDISIAFANTGCEDPRTLDFVHECESKFGWDVAWLEAVIHPNDGQSSTFKIVDYESAARKGEPFTDAIAKYGIFNPTAKSCTTKLKELPLTQYRKSVGFVRGKGLNYDTAIGIRYDELDRRSSAAVKERLVYPLIENKITKRDVALTIQKWEKEYGFKDLQLPGDHFGNCQTCYKKSLRKLLTVAKQCPSAFDWNLEMEEKYGTVKAGPEYASAKEGRRYFFRQHMPTAELLRLSKESDFKMYEDDPYEHGKDIEPEWPELPQLNTVNGYDLEVSAFDGCGESCEAFVNGFDVVEETDE